MSGPTDLCVGPTQIFAADSATLPEGDRWWVFVGYTVIRCRLSNDNVGVRLPNCHLVIGKLGIDRTTCGMGKMVRQG